MAEEQAETLSERELELVQLLSQGLSNREIAQKLYISPNTVKVHLRNIYSKLKVSSRTEATMAALKMGWVEIDRAEGGDTVAQGAEDQSITPELPFLVASGALTGAAAVRKDTYLPLALWQRVYLVVCAVLVAVGLWAIWPNRAEQLAPFTDRPVRATTANLERVSRWKGLAQMPTPRDRLAVVAHQGRIYAIAGEAAAGVSSAVEAYLPDEDSWVRSADKPTAVANVGAVVLGNRIYVPGGSTGAGQISDQLEVYDPDTGTGGTWSVAARMPTGLSAYAVAAYQGEMYLFGGWDGQSYVAASFRYDPRTDVWVPLAELPTPRAFTGAGAIGDRIYVVGGYDGRTELATCEAYRPDADTWEPCPAMSAPRGGVGTAVIADTLYVIGGGWNSYLVENEYFSPAQGTWNTFPSPLLQEWRNLGVASTGTFLYAVGGWDGEFLGVNEAYRAIYRLYMPSTMGQGGGAR
jgi:DNA-binding CsgD family transcriptional regulator/N-acetylneuraminic acid mutarotase